MNKQYRHKETGEIYNGKSIVLDGKRIFAPQEQHLLAAGYEEYTPAPPTPLTAEQLAAQKIRERMMAIEDELRSMDYLTSKYIDGEDMSEYDDKYGGDWKAYRHGLREEYNQLEKKIIDFL